MPSEPVYAKTVPTVYAACQCKGCVSACEQCPGWPTPAEATKMLDAGLANKMMLDWMTSDRRLPNFTYILSPAVRGCEGNLAPDLEGPGDFMAALMYTWKKGRCTFLDKGLCGIHESGFKPLQCRALTHDDNDYVDNWAIAKLWDTDEGKAVVARWREETNCDEASGDWKLQLHLTEGEET